MTQPTTRPELWLAAANALWLLGGLLAFTTRTSLGLVTAIAVVPAIPGLLDLRRRAPGTWSDRALAAALGTWAVMAILIVTPYMATEEGVSLWTSRGFAGLGLAAAAIGMLLWNFCALRGAEGTSRTAWMYGGFHVAALAVALYLVATGDGGVHDVLLRGDTYAVVDLRVAPAVAAMAGLVWVAAFLRGPPPDGLSGDMADRPRDEAL